jgi:hypothetical protein
MSWMHPLWVSQLLPYAYTINELTCLQVALQRGPVQYPRRRAVLVSRPFARCGTEISGCCGAGSLFPLSGPGWRLWRRACSFWI